MSEITISDEARKAERDLVHIALNNIGTSPIEVQTVVQLAINSTTASLLKRIEELEKQVNDNERWQREVLADFYIEFDDHEIGRRLAFTQWMSDTKKHLETWVARSSGYVQEEQIHGTHRELAEKVESLEKQLLAMREALTEFNVGIAFVTAMRPGSENAFVKAIQLYNEVLHSTPSDLASKYSKREVLEKCVYAMTAGREGPNTWSIWNQAIDAARKELETK